MKIALIGAGYWGSNILRVLNELGVLSLVCDEDENILQQVRTRYPNIEITSNLDRVLNSDVDAVAIATPARTHFEIAKRVIEAGKDVFVEKPLALALSDAENLRSLTLSNKTILMVGHILRYHPAVEKLKELIVSGKLGKINYVYSNRLNFGKLRVEENILWSFAPHDISTILMLLGEEPVAVSASGGDYLNRGIFDTTLTLLEFANGVKGHIFVSWLHPFKEQKLVVVGSKGMAVFDDVSREKLFLYPHSIEWKEGKPIAHKAEHQVVPFEPAEPLREELRHFINCIQTREQPRTDGREGLQVLKVLDRAEKCLNRTPERRGGSEAPGSALSAAGVSVHESAYIDPGVAVGRGSKVWHFSHVLKGSRIGRDCSIGQNVVIGPNALVGDHVKIQNNVSVYEGVELEDHVFCGPSMVFTNVYNPRSEIPRMKEMRKTVVRRGATIGANATIVCGNTVGQYAFIGAGAVVTKDVPDYALVMGNPARQAGWICRCGEKLALRRDKAVCGVCGSGYVMKDKLLVVVGRSRKKVRQPADH